MINGLSHFLLKYRNSYKANLLVGVLQFGMGLGYFIYSIKIVDGYLTIKSCSMLWSAVVLVLFGFKSLMTAWDIICEPRFNRKSEEWITKNNKSKEIYNQ